MLKYKQIKLGRLTFLGVEEPWQVPLLMPNSYKDMSLIFTSFAQHQFCLGQPVVVKGKVINEPETTWNKKAPKTQFILMDNDGNTISFTMFGDTRNIVKSIIENPEIYVFGCIDTFNNKMQLRDAEIVSESIIGNIVGVYPGKAKKISPTTSQKKVLELLDDTVDMAEQKIKEKIATLGIPNRLVRRAINCPQWTLSEVLKQIHRPSSLYDAEVAQGVMERIEALCLVSALQNAGEKKCAKNVIRKKLKNLPLNPFLTPYEFTLTKEQIKSIESVKSALLGENPYRFLLLGDVGTGKSAIMMSSSAYVASAGERAVMLFPNQSLAMQMYRDFVKAFPTVKCQLVTGDTKENIDLTQFDVLIGTTALLFREVGEFSLCITDEEQKLSVGMKEQLAGRKAHQLIASATPIPRTTSLAQHGGVEILRLTKCHVKKDFVTSFAFADDAKQMTEDAKAIIAAGGKVLVVCPKRTTDDEDDEDELPSAETIGANWNKIIPGLVRVSHSGLKTEENEQAIDDVKTGKARMLVATSVVEVGINIPDLWMVIIVDAKRFGLTTLHQIRGRLIRNGENNGVGYCVLYCPGHIKAKTKDRLTVLVNEQDGFEIAKEDLMLRGIGDVTQRGKTQHGNADAMCIGKEVDVRIVEEILGLFEDYQKVA